jgi:Arc/MetJ family transcription regulator
MPTNLALDDRLIEQARNVGKHRTKKEAVTAALREYVQRRRQREILALAGTVEYRDDCDSAVMRRRRAVGEKGSS